MVTRMCRNWVPITVKFRTGNFIRNFAYQISHLGHTA